MIQRSQNEIMSTWRSRDCVASIVCTTYNQEKHIGDALHGFLSQKTSFPFEIIIHDDASTDDTANIVRAFAARYPAIIKPILQVENQYSKGGFKPAPFAARSSQGLYIALCEGDDYWIDENKLQCQVDALELNADVDFSFHAAYVLTHGSEAKLLSWAYGENGRLSLDTLLNARIGSFAPTASYVFRRRVFDDLPPWFIPDAPVGDFFLERYGALRGGALYFKKPMSVYRSMSPGSWTVNIKKNSVANRRYLDGMCKSLQLMEPDFSAHSKEFRKFCARFYLKHAIEELLRGDDGRFKELILKSVQQWKYLSRKQWFCYQFRLLPFFVRSVLRRRGHMLED
jgi:glycosyltransferase involved in cell wall biosynthesis